MPDGGTLILSAENIRLDEEYALRASAARPIPYVRISVEDTGSGIPREVKDRIFDPFFTTKDPGQGTGLGLSTSLSIVKSYGGFMDLDTAMGKGSIFNVFFPALTESTAESEDEDEAIPLGRNELILVIDDESAVREITDVRRLSPTATPWQRRRTAPRPWESLPRRKTRSAPSSPTS